MFFVVAWCFSPTANAAEGSAKITRKSATGTATRREGEYMTTPTGLSKRKRVF